jgi:hypothetical protein
MGANEQFQKDLATGKEAEIIMAEMLERKGCTNVELNEDTNLAILKEYDIKYNYNNSTLKMEIKYDLQTPLTHNVAVEIISNGKPSGLITTKSDFWAFMVQDKFYIIPTKELKVLVENFPLIYSTKTTNWIYLIPLSDLVKASNTRIIPKDLLIN